MIRINLIREHELQAVPYTGAGRLLLCLLGIVVLAGIQLTLRWRAAALIEVRDSLRLEIARQESAVQRAHSENAVMSADADEVAGSPEVGARLRRVAEAVPSDLWLVSYSERRGEVTMRGMASNDDAPRLFVENLVAGSVFGRVEITEAMRRSAPDDEPRKEQVVQEFVVRAVLRDGAPAAGAAGGAVG